MAQEPVQLAAAAPTNAAPQRDPMRRLDVDVQQLEFEPGARRSLPMHLGDARVAVRESDSPYARRMPQGDPHAQIVPSRLEQPMRQDAGQRIGLFWRHFLRCNRVGVEPGDQVSERLGTNAAVPEVGRHDAKALFRRRWGTFAALRHEFWNYLTDACVATWDCGSGASVRAHDGRPRLRAQALDGAQCTYL